MEKALGKVTTFKTYFNLISLLNVQQPTIDRNKWRLSIVHQKSHLVEEINSQMATTIKNTKDKPTKVSATCELIGVPSFFT